METKNKANKKILKKEGKEKVKEKKYFFFIFLICVEQLTGAQFTFVVLNNCLRIHKYVCQMHICVYVYVCLCVYMCI